MCEFWWVYYSTIGGYRYLCRKVSRLSPSVATLDPSIIRCLQSSFYSTVVPRTIGLGHKFFRPSIRCGASSSLDPA